MAVQFPLFVLDEDGCSMELIEKQEDVLRELEEIDIQNGIYLFWDANGAGARLQMKRRKVMAVENCESAKSLTEAFQAYCESLELAVDLRGSPIEVWNRIVDALKRRPKKKGVFARLFSKQSMF
jgi:hypothetical protein